MNDESKPCIVATSAEAFENLRTDTKTRPNHAIIETGNTFESARHRAIGSVFQVSNADKSTQFWRVTESEQMETGAFRYTLERQTAPSPDSVPWLGDLVTRSTMSAKARSFELIRRYGVALGIFMLGWHLHAQAWQLGPFWKDDCSLYHDIANPESQEVTARWMMIAGIVLWGFAHYRIADRIGKTH